MEIFVIQRFGVDSHGVLIVDLDGGNSIVRTVDGGRVVERGLSPVGMVVGIDATVDASPEQLVGEAEMRVFLKAINDGPAEGDGVMVMSADALKSTGDVSGRAINGHNGDKAKKGCDEQFQEQFICDFSAHFVAGCRDLRVDGVARARHQSRFGVSIQPGCCRVSRSPLWRPEVQPVQPLHQAPLLSDC